MTTRIIHRWEYAQRVPNLEDLLLLADALALRPVDLLGDEAARKIPGRLGS